MMQTGFTLISQVHRLHDRLFSAKTRLHADVPLNASQMRLTAAIWEAGELGVQELAERTCLTKSTVSDTLPRLIDEGIVELRPGEHDHRFRIVSLTDKGRMLQQRHDRFLADEEARLFSGTTAEERAVFFKVLQTLKDNLLAENEDSYE